MTKHLVVLLSSLIVLMGGGGSGGIKPAVAIHSAVTWEPGDVAFINFFCDTPEAFNPVIEAIPDGPDAMTKAVPETCTKVRGFVPILLRYKVRSDIFFNGHSSSIWAFAPEGNEERVWFVWLGD